MISNEILQKIDDETDIVSLVSEFVSLEKKGKNFMGLCPFHEEKTPSFSVNPDKNIAMCMGCREGGRPINFYRRIKNISFMEAVRDLGERLGIKIDLKTNEKEDKNKHLYEIMAEVSRFYNYSLNNSVSGQEVLQYLYDRKLTDETINQFNLGYSSKDKDQLYQFLKSREYSVSDMINLGLVKQANDGSYYDLFNNRLMFPITDDKGRVIAFSARAIAKAENIKYINSPETIIFKKGNTVYNLNESGLDIRRNKHAILFEGFFDVISSYQAGIKNGIATMGTALTSNQANLIKRLTDKVVTAYDGDKAGINATISAIPILQGSNLEVETLQLPSKMDPDDYIKKYGEESYQKLLENNVVDPYKYQFDYYLSSVDLKNANDLVKFQSQVVKLLTGASPAIVALYKKKTAELLNINEADIIVPDKQISKKNNQTNNYHQPYPEELPGQNDYVPEYFDIPDQTIDSGYPKIPYRDVITHKLGKSHYNAELELIVILIFCSEYTNYINNKLSPSEYADADLAAIRIKVNDNIERNNGFDLSLLRTELNEKELEILDNKITKTHLWINGKAYMDEIVDEWLIDNHINLLKEAGLLRRIQLLLDLMTEKQLISVDFSNDNEEYVKLKMKLHDRKET